MACSCTGNLRTVETAECNLGSVPFRSTLYPVSVYPGTGTKYAGGVQGTAVCGNDYCTGVYKLPKEEGAPAAGGTWITVFP